MTLKTKRIKEGISAKDALQILTKQALPVINMAIANLVAINPTWSIMFVSAIGIINLWGDYGQARTNELVQYLDLHSDEFLDEVLESDKFKSIFLNVFERQMKEVMAEKRSLLRDYLLNVGKGIHDDFDNHTKILFALDQISLEEISLLNWLLDHKDQENLNIDSIISDFVYSGQHLDMNKLEFLVQSLGNYGVTLLKTSRYNGTFYEISDFGEIFLDFIHSSNLRNN